MKVGNKNKKAVSDFKIYNYNVPQGTIPAQHAD